jgi:hypothetical protein
MQIIHGFTGGTPIAYSLENPGYYGRLARRIVKRYTAVEMGKAIARLIDNAVRNAGRKKPYPLQQVNASTPGLMNVAVEALKLDNLNTRTKK